MTKAKQRARFGATKSELIIIQKIARRSMAMFIEHGHKLELIDAIMDIEACHSNGCPLDLEKLLAADDFNFAHDVFGINRHINRDTGKLENFFLPRAARG